MRSASPLWERNSRKAKAVVAKPPGTRMPARASWLIISPSDAFLPPTRSTSPIRRWSKKMTRCCSLMPVAPPVTTLERSDRQGPDRARLTNGGASSKPTLRGV